jgi:nucleoid-associated protein YgaU
MRTIGNIERFLVIGIVVVIGAILIVAIRGADDLNSAYSDKVAKSKTADPKKGGTPGLHSEMPRSNPAAGGHNELRSPEVKPSADPGASHLSPELQEALDRKITAANGAGATPAGAKTEGAPKPDTPSKGAPKDDAGSSNKALTPPSSLEDPPVVLEDDPKTTPQDGKVPGTGGSKTDKPDPKEVGGVRETKAPATLQWTYEVQPGDRLERIASALYGERNMWKDIAAANSTTITDPARLHVGSQLTLPKEPVNTAVVGLSHGAGASDVHAHVTVPDHLQPKDDAKSTDPKVAVAPPAKSTKSGSFKRVTSSDQYQVQHGDTLMAIAATHYGTRSAWRMILDANSDVIPDKDHIKPGIVIKLPAE